MIDYKNGLRKRREESDGVGFYTYWDKKSPHGCIYCGRSAETREHIPSKVFLKKPYPDNLFTIPACYECNNGYSLDEEYTACCIESLKSLSYKIQLDEQIRNLFDRKPTLYQLVNSQINREEGRLVTSFDEKRICRILNKLAICFTGYEFDNLHFSEASSIWFDFAPNLSYFFIQQFTQPIFASLLPEVSSRFSSDYCKFIVSEKSDTIKIMYDWIVVQEQQFQYQVSIKDRGIQTKMVISDFLYAKVGFNKFTSIR